MNHRATKVGARRARYAWPPPDTTTPLLLIGSLSRRPQAYQRAPVPPLPSSLSNPQQVLHAVGAFGRFAVLAWIRL